MELIAGIAQETPVLTAEGRIKAAVDIAVGEAVYGSVRGANRHYAVAYVRSVARHVADAVRIAFGDGTVLHVARDQRILSCRGWKHATGAEQGRRRRAHLTLGATAPGTGRFHRRIEQTHDYELGYLTGLIRGDGHLRSYECTDRRGRPWIKHNFRLALADAEPLDRADLYLRRCGVITKRFLFQRATETRRPIDALGNQTGRGVGRVKNLIRWPTEPGTSWFAGFLAGIFDAEGSAGRGGVVRICNCDPEVIDWTWRAFHSFGFETVLEPTVGRNGLTSVRLRGGLKEKLRLFHLTDPAILRKRAIAGVGVRTHPNLRVVSITPVEDPVRLVTLSTTRGDVVAEGLLCEAGTAR